VETVIELPDGYAFRLPGDLLRNAADFIARDGGAAHFLRSS